MTAIALPQRPDRRVRRPATHGFTLVEILMALVAASVLALTAGALLVYLFDGLAWNTEQIEGHRDGAYAVAVLQHHLRSAAPGEVSVAGEEIRIQSGGVIKRFRRVGEDLEFDPNLAAGGNDELLIRSGVTGFTPILFDGRVDVLLVVVVDGVRTEYPVAATFRN